MKHALDVIMMKINYLIFTGLLMVLFSCSSGEKEKIGELYITDVKTKDTLFSTEWVDLNQQVEIIRLIKKPSYNVGVFHVKSQLASLSLVVPLDKRSNLFQLRIPESFLKGTPLNGQKFISFGGNRMLDDYEKIMNDAKLNRKDTSLSVNGFIHGLYKFNRNYPRSGIVGYHIYEAELNGGEDMFSYFSNRSKKEWKTLSSLSNDLFTKELKRIKESGNIKNCIQHSPQKLVFQSSNSSIHPDLLKNQVKVLIFWATWCAPCKVQMMQLAKLNKAKYGDSPVYFAAVTSESDEKMVFNWVEKNWDKYKCGDEWEYESSWLSFFHDNKHCMATNYQIQQYPTIMVFDKKDRLVKSYCTIQDVQRIVDSLLVK